MTEEALPSAPLGHTSSGTQPHSHEPVPTARRVAAQHRRWRARRWPGWCGFCGCRWQAGTTRTGKLARGCHQRRGALEILDAVGELDASGRPVTADLEADA